MCGVVGFLGDVPDALGRVLFSMEALSYRAPDSTGAGAFGDDREPVRTRKAVGGVSALREVLARDPLFPPVRGLFPPGADALREARRNLFTFEGLPESLPEAPAFSDFLSGVSAPALGAFGRPDREGDGVSGLFRLLDAVLLARFHVEHFLRDGVERAFLASWREAPEGVSWRGLLLAERAAGVLGRAAWSALEYLAGEARGAASFRGGITPEVLRVLLPPVMGHGRWAQQAAVSAENAHPFTDAARTRLVVLNGIFSGETEGEARAFLLHVAGASLRTENSTEYLALLWGHAFDLLAAERARRRAGEAPRAVSLPAGVSDEAEGLPEMADDEVDALAFRMACRVMASRGGSLAALGMSVRAPRALLFASMRRPLFIVRRAGSEDIMTVSDVAASRGLFTEAEAEAARRAGAGLPVEVTALCGEAAFGRIETILDGGAVRRGVTVSGERPRSFPAVLDTRMPERGDAASYCEAHLAETPGCIKAQARECGENPGFETGVLSGRFGGKLARLRRVWLLGCGSSHHAALCAAPFFSRAGFSCEAPSLHDVADAAPCVSGESDLALLCTWSGTTAEVSALARELSARGCVFAVATEHPFSDVAVMTRGRGGVLPLFTGPEAAIPAVKGPPALVAALARAALWLSERAGRGEGAPPALSGDLSRCADGLAAMLRDHGIAAFVETLVEAARGADAVVFVDSREGVGREAALKVTELTGTLAGLWFPPEDADHISALHDPRRTLVVVSTTDAENFSPILSAMWALNRAGVAFHVVARAPLPAWEGIPVSPASFCEVPGDGGPLQAVLDMVFFSRLALRLAQIRGAAPDAPRNRVKSVTIAGPRPPEAVEALRSDLLGFVSAVAEWRPGVPAPDGFPSRLRPYAEDALRVAAALDGEGVNAQELPEGGVEEPDEGGPPFVAPPREARQAAHALAHALAPLCPGGVGVAPWGSHPSSPHDAVFLRAFAALGGALAARCAPHDRELAGALSLAFGRGAAGVIRAVLGDAGLQGEIRLMARETRDFRRALVIGPPGGAGEAFADALLPAFPAVFAPFGAAGHGPVSLVDAGEKFVALESRERMVALHGEVRVASWEARHLGSLGVSGFLREPHALGIPFGPFRAGGAWRIPALAAGFDPSGDALVFVDATDEAWFGAALDELGALGCRNAVAVVLVQAAHVRDPGKNALFSYPVSYLMTLPAAGPIDAAVALPRAMLPLARDIVAHAWAAARLSAVRARGAAGDSPH